METLSGFKPKKKSFAYLGKGTEFTLIFFKNLLLTIITFGLYYPWARVEKLKYHYTSTELENTRFYFNGTGKETFKDFISWNCSLQRL